MSDKKTVTFIMHLPTSATLGALFCWALLFTAVGAIEVTMDNQIPILLCALMFGTSVYDHIEDEDEYKGGFGIPMFRYRLLRMGVGCLGVGIASFIMFDDYALTRAVLFASFPFMTYVAVASFLPGIASLSVTNKYKFQDMQALRSEAQKALVVVYPITLFAMLHMDLLFTMKDYRVSMFYFITLIAMWGTQINPKFKE